MATDDQGNAAVGERRLAGRARLLAVLATLMVAAVVIGAVALSRENNAARATVNDASTALPSLSPAPPSRKETRVARSIAMQGVVSSVGANGNDRVMTVWRTCPSAHDCQYAWDLHGTHYGLLGHAADGSGPVVYPAGSGYILKAWDRRGVVVGEDGMVMPLHPGPPQPIQSGTVVVHTGKGLQLVNPNTAETWPLPMPPGDNVRGVLDAAVDAHGTLWTLPAASTQGVVTVSWLDGDGWHSHRVNVQSSTREVPGALVVSSPPGEPTEVAVLATFDGATSLPVGSLAFTQDAGRSWHQLARADVPFSTAGQMAATSEGTLYVADAAGRLWHTTDGGWASFVRAPAGGPVTDLSSAGPQVLARIAPGMARLQLEFKPGGPALTLAP